MPKALSFIFALIGTCSLALPAPLFANQTPTMSLEFGENGLGKYLAATYASSHNLFPDAAKWFQETLDTSPNNSLILQNTYKSLLLSGEIEPALGTATQYLTFAPESLSANLLLTIAAAKNKRYTQATQHLSSITTPPSQGLESLHLLVIPLLSIWLDLANDQADSALTRLRVLRELKVIPELFLRAEEARVEEFLGNKKKASELYRSFLGKEGISQTIIKSASDFFIREGDPATAHQLINQFKAEQPTSPYFETILSELETGKITMPASVSINENLALILTEAARSFLRSNVMNEALAYAQLANYLTPNQSEALFILANHYAATGAFTKAISYYRQIPETSELAFTANLGIATLQYESGDATESKQHLLELSQASPRNPEPLILLADLLRSDHKFYEAARIYRKAIKRLASDDKRLWALLFARGICYEQIGKWEKAERDFLSALALMPEEPELLNYLGYSWATQNQNLGKARQLLEKALSKTPDAPHILDSMGWVHYQLKEYDKAALFTERAIESMPYDPAINDHLGDIYWHQERFREAKFQWQRALENSGEESTIEQNTVRKLELGLTEHSTLFSRLKEWWERL